MFNSVYIIYLFFTFVKSNNIIIKKKSKQLTKKYSFSDSQFIKIIKTINLSKKCELMANVNNS